MSIVSNEIRSCVPDHTNHRTPQMQAVNRSPAACVRFLLHHGANPNVRDVVGRTPLMFASLRGDLSSLKYLLSYGAQCNLATKHKFSHLSTRQKFPRSTTALHLAAASNSVECVRELIQSGADCSCQDKFGRTSLSIATELGLSECALAHFDSTTNQDFLFLKSWATLNTPLHFAVKLQMEKCVEALVRRKADVSIKNRDNNSPLTLALINAAKSVRNVKILRTILVEGHNLDIRQINMSRCPAIDFICSRIIVEGPFQQISGICGNHLWRRPQLVKFLLAYGVKAGTTLQDSLNMLDHELNVPDEEFGLLKRIVDILPRTRRCDNLSLNVPEEFIVEPNGRKIFTQLLLAHLRNHLPPPLYVLHERKREMYLTSDDQTVSKGLRIFWPPENMISDMQVETYIAFHLSKGHRVEYMSYEDFSSELHQLWGRWCIYLKKKWYQDTIKNPRSLKDSCRYAVRIILDGNYMARNIKKINIPSILQSYLLFFEDID